MRIVRLSLALLFVLPPVLAQEKTDGPSDEKARKTYEKAQKSLHEHKTEFALDDFKKADKQDGGHCLDCQRQMIKYGRELGDWKAAELAAEEMVAEAQSARDTAISHYQFAVILMEEGLQKHKEEIFARAHEEISKSLAAYSNFPDAFYADGRVLAQLKRDDEAKARFEQYVKTKPAVGIFRGLGLHVLLKSGFCFVVPFQLGKHPSIDEERIREIRISGERFADLLVGASENFFFVLLQSLLHEDHRKLVVRNGRISCALSFGHHLLCGKYGGLPIPELSSVFDHLPPAVKAMPAVLFVCFLEVVESEFRLVFVQGLLGFLIGLAGLFIGGAVRLLLGQDGGQNKQQSQTEADNTHRRPPANPSTRRSGTMELELTAESSFLDCQCKPTIRLILMPGGLIAKWESGVRGVGRDS